MRAKAHFRCFEDRTGAPWENSRYGITRVGCFSVATSGPKRSATMVALGLYSYNVRELLASLFLFSALFLALGLIVLGAVIAWYASEQVALWSRLVSRNAVAFTFSARSASLAAGVNKKS